jgi:hypothetical protein
MGMSTFSVSAATDDGGTTRGSPGGSPDNCPDESSFPRAGAEFGGPCRDRTYDQEIKSLLLYQLS